MDLHGLLSNIYNAEIGIDAGRKGFATKGRAEEGRILYETGIAEALTSFMEAQSTRDPQIILLAEYTFLTQELELTSKTDIHTINSLTQAIQSFDDAFLALQIVEDKTLYQGANKTYPRHRKYRIKAYPKDAYHIAFISHRTRIQNILRTPGVDPIEKDLLEQRLSNLSTAQVGYVEKQRKALSIKN